MIQRSDDKPEAIRRRLETFERDTFPLLSFYESRDLLVKVNGDQSVEKVAADIDGAHRRAGPGVIRSKDELDKMRTGRQGRRRDPRGDARRDPSGRDDDGAQRTSPPRCSPSATPARTSSTTTAFPR